MASYRRCDSSFIRRFLVFTIHKGLPYSEGNLIPYLEEINAKSVVNLDFVSMRLLRLSSLVSQFILAFWK